MNSFAGFLASKLGFAVTLVAAALGVYLLATHTGHALAAAPYLFLLACPLMIFSDTTLDLVTSQGQISVRQTSLNGAAVFGFNLRASRRCGRCLHRPWSLMSVVGHSRRFGFVLFRVAGWLKRAHPEDEFYRVSHETIYRSLFVQARGVLKKELLHHLRSKRTIRRSKRAGLNGDGRGQIT